MRGFKKERVIGQSLVEFALVLPLLLLFIVMIIDIGRVTYYYSVIYNASREGARQGIVNPKREVMVDAAQKLMIGLNISNEAIVTEGINPTDKIVKVKITYEFVPVTPLAAQLLGKDKILITSSSAMNIEK
jgi:hypothetical protein